jgi:hypothetical protein
MEDTISQAMVTIFCKNMNLPASFTIILKITTCHGKKVCGACIEALIKEKTK